eukprot:776314-Prorocentrum_minimum.AAC.3
MRLCVSCLRERTTVVGSEADYIRAPDFKPHGLYMKAPLTVYYPPHSAGLHGAAGRRQPREHEAGGVLGEGAVQPCV